MGNFLQNELEVPTKRFQDMTHEYLQQSNRLLRTSEAFGGKNDAMVTERVMTPSSSANSFATKSEINSVTDRDVIQKLQQLEDKRSQKTFKVLLKTPSHSSLENYLTTFRKAFDSLGYKVLIDSSSGGPTSVEQLDAVWCLSRNGSSSCGHKNPLDLHKNQKISPVPGMDKLLFRNDGFCFLMSASQKIPALQNQAKMSLPCYVLPAQFNKFLHDNNKRGTLTLKSLGSVVTPSVKWGALDRDKIDTSLKGVLQLFPSDKMAIEGNPVIVQVYALVNFVSPLRVYRHSEGCVIFLDKGKNTACNWNLDQFFQHLDTSFGAGQANEVIEQMDDLVVKMLLILEPSLFTYFTSLATGTKVFRCQGCFQPLKISFAFSSRLNPFILEAKSVSYDQVSDAVIQETVNLLFMQSSVLFSEDVYLVLKSLKLTSLFDKKSQWSDVLLKYLLDTKQEALHMGNFKRLYPSSDDSSYRAMIRHLLDTGVELHYKQTNDLRTPDVHEILRAFVAVQEHKHVGTLIAGWSDARLSKGSRKNVKCSNDQDAVPVLLELNTKPTVDVKPQFSSAVYTYQTRVPFNIMVLQIWGKVSACHMSVRINTKYEDNQASNHSLGVGWNKFSIFVVDTSQSIPDALATYNLFVFREGRSEIKNTFDKDSAHQVCVYHQECSLKVYPNKPCGLEKLAEATWTTFLNKQSELPVCETGHELGRWLLPCDSCSDSVSCYWRQAVWAPYTCHYNVLSEAKARKCLANKKILFVGDSTNRGIMYYLMEKLNGSLRKWEKTHTMKIYSDELNGGRTSVSFAYYPQFWLPQNKRPAFVKALYQLVARFLPLENNSNTILVVGGVQWVGVHHITETNMALTSLGLNGIKVIVKSLGSGFHLPVPGLPRHDLVGQQKIAERNQLVINASKLCGYQVVDTLGMTISRYKDFLMGNCGCHFHKVVDMRSFIREEDEMSSPLVDNSDKDTDHLPRYHVIGPINSVYSELVISRMCS